MTSMDVALGISSLLLNLLESMRELSRQQTPVGDLSLQRLKIAGVEERGRG